MASKFLAVFLVAVAACNAQQCQPQPAACGCAQQPTVIQMTCGGGAPALPVPPPPPPPPPPAFTTTSAPTEEPTTVFVADDDAETCNDDNNLAIVIDSSGSVNYQGAGNYDLFLNFASKLATAWKKNPANGVAVIIYSSSVETLFDLQQGAAMDEATLEQTILGAQYMGSSTATNLGLEAAEQVLSYATNPSLPKNVVVITDGTSDDQSATYASAQQLAMNGINLIAVGVGPGQNVLELSSIVNDNPDHVFSAENFSDLPELTKKISQALCQPPTAT